MSPRSFAILALATVASVALAVHAVRDRDLPVQTATAGQAMFPTLLDDLNDVREVRIATSGGKLTVKAKDQGWVLAEKADYPVEAAKIRDLGLALANLQLVEAKTADPKRLPRLELDGPGADGAKGRLVELSGANGTPLAAAVVGKTSPSLYGSGRGGVYARRAGENQAWLAAGELDVSGDAMGLIGTEVIDIPADQVARVVLQPSDEAPVTLARASATAEFTTDAALPDDRKLDPVKIESLTGILAGLTMTDVRPSSEIAAEPAKHTRFETFDGVGIDLAATTLGEGDTAEHWLSLQASGGDTKPDPNGTTKATPSIAAKIHKLAGWSFKVPAYLADRLAGGIDQLLADPKPAS